ncbi:MAG: UbiA family prenyltransferase, partial [Bacteroidota bacterium]
VLIDKEISRHLAINLHTVLNVIGVGLGIYLSFHIKIPGMSLLFLLTAGMLWFYSSNYKRQFFIGNLIVSLMIGIVPMMVILFELPLLNRQYGETMLKAGANFNYIFYWVAGFSFFAFFTNLIREIVKDAEDFEGDSAYGMNTFPVQLGIPLTKVFIIFLISILLVMLALVLYKYILLSAEEFDFLSGFYFLMTIFIPLLFVIFQIAIAKNRRDYHLSSQILKMVMLFGVLYSVIVFYMLNFRLN